jgi:hypothetical protein
MSKQDNKNQFSAPEANVPEETKNTETLKAETKKFIRTLYFSEGFWCEELNQSFSIGYYTPKDEKENDILKKFAGQEQNHLGPVSKKGI